MLTKTEGVLMSLVSPGDHMPTKPGEPMVSASRPCSALLPTTTAMAPSEAASLILSTNEQDPRSTKAIQREGGI